jgi:phosphoglycolate phosphatase
MPSKYDFLLLDFDFTLADSSRGVVKCVNYALSALGLAPADPQSISKTIGYSLPETLTQLSGEQDDALRRKFAGLFVKRADQVMADLTTVYDYVPQAVARLKQKGLTLAIVSTKYRYRIEEILTRDGLLGFFTTIVGGEDVKLHKPDPAGLSLAMRQLAASPGKTLYAGDSLVDAEAAKRCGVDFAAVLSGTTAKEEFSALPVKRIFPNLEQLTEWVLG